MTNSSNENKQRVKKYLGLENVSILAGAGTSGHLGAPVIRSLPSGLKQDCVKDIETYFGKGRDPSFENLMNCLQADRFIKEKKGNQLLKLIRL